MSGRERTAPAARENRATKPAMIAILFVVIILVVVLVYLSAGLKSKIETNNQRVTELNDAIADEEARVEEIEQLQQDMQSDEYIKQVAKDKLGMVEDGEILFKDSK